VQQPPHREESHSPGVADHFDRAVARGLTARYALALTIVAVLTIVGQVVVQIALHQTRSDAEVVNLAGRQRMLSQAIAKSALAWRQGDAGRIDDLRARCAAWTGAHHRLSRSSEPGMGIHNSPDVAHRLAALDGHVAAIAAAVEALPGDPTAVDRIQAAEGPFLAGMEGIVVAYQGEAQARVAALERLELAICVLLLLILGLEVLFVFRPAVARLRLAIADRERLRSGETAQAVLNAEAAIVRRIGQDLHDGLGQSLTALSLHASALRRDLAGSGHGPQAEVIAQLAARIVVEAREAARGLAPVGIHADLSSAIRELAVASSAAQVACEVDWPDGVQPAATASEDCYRIVQEAVTNAIRHGGARRIRIRASTEDDAFHLRITDDGVWKPGPAGMGRSGMAWRAGRHGGTVRAGPLDTGSEVHVRIPGSTP
jgi:signal transduction histidine kinase